jgi:gamma-glutamyltranspeptidase/glutathione hydrolase
MTDGGRVYLESGISPAVRKELEAMGHNVSEQRASMGGYQAIIRDDVRGVYFGASESRKDGQAAGY